MTDSKLNRSAAAGELMTAGKAAEILGISEATVRNWAKLGKLSSVSSCSAVCFHTVTGFYLSLLLHYFILITNKKLYFAEEVWYNVQGDEDVQIYRGR